MDTLSTCPQPGFYQYTYPTFVDTPQHICVHFLTPDGQQAFVSYPHHPSRKAAQLIPVRWFQSVSMLQLEGQHQLMDFISRLFTGWYDDRRFESRSDRWLSNELNGCGVMMSPTCCTVSESI